MSSRIGQVPLVSQTTNSLQGSMRRSATRTSRVTAPRSSAAFRKADSRNWVLPFLRGLPCNPRISMAFASALDVALGAGNRPGTLAGRLAFLVALGAQLVHDLLAR